MNTSRSRWILLCFLIASLAFVACGDDEDSPTSTTLPPATDTTGNWSVSETVDATGCGEGVVTDTYTIQITQTGNNLVVVTPAGMFSGSISASTVRWSGSYPEDGGTTTINSLSVTVSGDGASFSGNTSWSWTDGVDSCSGTSQVSGTKL